MTGCTTDGCDRPVRHIRRLLCHACYLRYDQAGTLGPLPPLPAPAHTCTKHVPSATCYVSCRCRCHDCRTIRTDYNRRYRKQRAYGRYVGYVDAEPARQHVRQLMAPRVGSSRGMGWKRIARAAQVSNGTVTKLLYGDPQRGMPPSRRIKADNAERLLAVTADLADGSTIPAGPTRRLLREMVDGGFSKAELGRYITGDVRTASLQVAHRRTVQVGTADTVADLHRRWKAGQIVPRGRRSRHEHGPPSPFPATPAPPRCVDCGDVPLDGGLRCLPCFQTVADRRSAPSWDPRCGTTAGYARHHRAGERPCERCLAARNGRNGRAA